jgi:pimeloyl-ACP methyl ester carboxylesterase
VRDRFDSISKMTSIRAPVVIIHGEKDDVIPVRMGRQMAASRPGIHYVELPGVNHNNIPDLAAIVGRELKALLSPRKP